LNNKGTLLLRNIKTNSEYLPKAFVIKEGEFVFNQDKMKFDNFSATYGQSDFKMNGYMQNVIDFVLSDKGVLKGSFNVDANYINVDEFMSNSAKNQVTADASASSGVVVVPPNLDLQFNCLAQKVDFDELKMQNLKGNIVISNGKLQLHKSGFDIVGSNVMMDVVYGSETPEKAFLISKFWLKILM